MVSVPRDQAPPALWDPVVRLSHWALALVVLLNAVLTREGDSLHVWAGWAGLGTLALRMIWGVAGPREARFAAFPPRPWAALRHLGELARGAPRAYPSHNPAGAMMAYALWAALAVVIATGLLMTDGRTPMERDAVQAIVLSGDWSTLAIAGDLGEDDDEGGIGHLAEEVHEVAANLILFLVLIHVAGVFVEGRAMRKNLVAAMLTGQSADRRT